MNFQLSETQSDIQSMVRAGMARFPASYWRDADSSARFPHEFFEFAAEQGWLGIAIPVEYGGAGLGVTEAALVLEGVAGGGAGLSGASALHMNVFGVNVVVKHGSAAMKAEVLPRVAIGRLKVAFGVTEPQAGLDTASITTRAVRVPGGWRISGRKVWISTAQVADKILLLARTAPRDVSRKGTDGMALFFTDLDRRRIDVREIPKCGRAAVDSNELFIDDLFVPEEHLVGSEGSGFRLLLDGLNPERLLIAAEAIGIGRACLKIAVEYAKTRVVFGRPIGMNQGIQFPLAESHTKLEMAWLLVLKGTTAYDAGLLCGAEANMAKLMAAEFGFEAADRAMQALGGFGYAKEYDVERLWREAKLCRMVPITPELILAYVGERVLGLPKSY